MITEPAPNSATEMTAAEYKAARAVAARGRLLPAAPAVAPAVASPPPDDDTQGDPQPAASTSHPGGTPEPKQPGSGRGALDLDAKSYAAARAAIVREMDGGRTGRTSFARFGR